ncbi:MAG: glutamate 5-kinase [Actinomycetota bacterium]
MVIKVGTAVITEESGRVSRERASAVVDGIAAAKEAGVDVALVSSGAIAAGVERLGLDRRPADLDTLQAVASVGQGLLMTMYADMFASRGITAGQVLLTQYDITHRQQYLNARHTLDRLFSMGVVPVVNENDTVATEEITFGDNDMLAALVASLVKADLLVLLTDTAGLHTADPRTSGDARLIEVVEKVTEEIECLGGEAGSDRALGGMSSKVQAAKAAVSTGVATIIADGREPSTIRRVIEGERPGTYFPAAGRVTSKKHWIGYATMACGTLVVDAGAVRALEERGGSLLPAGVTDVRGEFGIGDSVDIEDTSGRLIARGLSNYSSTEARKVKGLRSQQVEQVLGERAEEMVHRDELVVFGPEAGGSP